MKRRILLIAVTTVLLLLTGCPNPTGSNGSGGSNGGGDDDIASTDDYTSANIGTLVYVPAGSFQRDGDDVDNISIISRPFRMSEHEITRSQFSAIMGTDPSDTDSSTGTDDPVQMVSWYDAIAFANKLSIEEGLTPVYSVTVDGTPIDWEALAYGSIPTASDDDWDAAIADWDADGYRLPTEMEWMWAAMGADQDAQPGAMQDGVNVSGYDKVFAAYDGSNSIDDYAWYRDNSDTGAGRTTHPVGTKNANELGLHDMSGNVVEWNWDWYETPYPGGEETDYRGAASGSFRMSRGGGWFLIASFCEVADRGFNEPQARNNYNGLRLVRQ